MKNLINLYQAYICISNYKRHFIEEIEGEYSIPEESRSEKNHFQSIPKDRGILTFEYKNLHDSVWDCHKVTWQSISIFIPILFTLQGFFVQKYPEISLPQVVMGATITESLVSIWRLMMHILARYNKIRTDRLIEIENLINKYTTSGVSIKQYHLLCGEDSECKEENRKCEPENMAIQGQKGKKGKWKILYNLIEKKISWGLVYNSIFMLITLLNVFSILLKAFSDVL